MSSIRIDGYFGDFVSIFRDFWLFWGFLQDGSVLTTFKLNLLLHHYFNNARPLYLFHSDLMSSIRIDGGSDHVVVDLDQSCTCIEADLERRSTK